MQPPDEVTKPRWFSIKEAAEYLAVGEPTIYRWMREGRMTYRKVGDSTRFFQEDLDALVQVHPSAKDVSRVQRFCPFCHHGELVDGQIRSTGLVYFQPKKSKFWTWRDSNVSTSARMCTRCGVIVQYGSTKKLEALRIEQPAEEEEPEAAEE